MAVMCSHSDLFNVQEVSGLVGDGVAWHGHVVVVRRCVREVAAHGERHRPVLWTDRCH